MTTPNAALELEAVCHDLTAKNCHERAYRLGRLIGDGLVDRASGEFAFQEALVASTDRDLKAAVREEGLVRFVLRLDESTSRGISDVTAEKPDNILIPGHHPNADVSSDAFAEAVIRGLPAGAIYRSGREIGQIIGDPGKRYFKPTTIDELRLIIDRNVRLARWVTKKSGAAFLSYVACTRDLAGLVLAAAQQHYLVRDIRMLTCYPVFTPHGLTQPGWHNGFFYDEPGELSPLDITTKPANPLDILYDLTYDFPFASEADRHNFIGLLLTPLVRPALDGNVPIHLIMASRERTGKSKLAEEVLGGVILGRKTPATQLPDEEVEIEKRITAKLRHGGTLWHLDNLNQHLDSAALASITTASGWEGRILGSSTLADLHNNLTIVGTGNNVKATLELVERTVPIFLQPKTEDPSQRTDFIHPDLVGYIAENRKTLLSTLLWMIRDWQAAGSPPSARRLGGFERWTAMVGGILEHHGFSEWLSNQRTWVKRGDPYGADLRFLLNAWANIHGSTKITAATVFDIAQANGIFEDIQGKTPSGRLVSFSKRVLRRKEDCPVSTDYGEIMLRSTSSGSNSAWFLQKVDGSLILNHHPETASNTF